MMNMENKDKKIRIVSFQNAHNFGAVCQAYGLQQTLLELGYKDVLFINYNPQYLKNRYNPWITWNYLNLDTSFPRKISRIIKWMSLVFSTTMRNIYFEHSIKRMLRQTPKELHLREEVAKETGDVLICGSDQIWNNSLTGLLDPVFFGLANKNGYKKIISYAPSTEIAALSESTLQKMAQNVEHFSHVSVREESVRNLLQPLVSKPIEVTVDPTILCSRNAFDRIASKRLVKNPYICVYAYFPDEELIQNVIKTIPKYENYEVRYILFTATNLYQWGNKSIQSVMPVEDFLSYFKYASYVVTNSFHGLAFSLLFEKNFTVTWEENKSTRTEALLRELNMKDKIVCTASDAKWKEIDYARVNGDLEAIRKKSINYLLNSIKS